MIPRSKIAPWSVADLRTAAREGWNVFNSDTDNARIERDDACDAFEGDAEAWEYVVREAAEGREHCRRALLHIAVHNPHEFRVFMKHVAPV